MCIGVKIALKGLWVQVIRLVIRPSLAVSFSRSLLLTQISLCLSLTYPRTRALTRAKNWVSATPLSRNPSETHPR